MKTPSGEEFLLMWGASVCCNSLAPPANLQTTGTVCQWFKSLHCLVYQRLLLWQGMDSKCPAENRHKHKPTFQKSQKETLTV